MIRKISFSISLLFAISCSTESLPETRIIKEIDNRIAILNNSYKFSIIPENLQGKKFDTLKFYINKLYSDNDIVNNYDLIRNSLMGYNIIIPTNGENKNIYLLNTLLGLDNLIFKYIPSRMNFSNYKPIVIPNKYELTPKDTLRLKIYLSVFDTLYEPEFETFILSPSGNIEKAFYIPCNKGVGEYNQIILKKGINRINGVAIYSNEFGSKDTLSWDYEYKVK